MFNPKLGKDTKPSTSKAHFTKPTQENRYSSQSRIGIVSHPRKMDLKEFKNSRGIKPNQISTVLTSDRAKRSISINSQKSTSS